MGKRSASEKPPGKDAKGAAGAAAGACNGSDSDATVAAVQQVRLVLEEVFAKDFREFGDRLKGEVRDEMHSLGKRLRHDVRSHMEGFKRDLDKLGPPELVLQAPPAVRARSVVYPSAPSGHASGGRRFTASPACKAYYELPDGVPLSKAADEPRDLHPPNVPMAAQAMVTAPWMAPPMMEVDPPSCASHEPVFWEVGHVDAKMLYSGGPVQATGFPAPNGIYNGQHAANGTSNGVCEGEEHDEERTSILEGAEKGAMDEASEDSLANEEVRKAMASRKESYVPPKKTSDVGRLGLDMEVARYGKKTKTKNWTQMSAEDFLTSAKFDNCIGALIFLNAIVIGVQCDYGARYVTEDVPPIFNYFEKGFLFLFGSELCLRLYVYKHKFFLVKNASALFWNVFDTLVVCSQVGEELMAIVAQGNQESEMGSMRVMRIMRILRLMRILRVMRVLRLISELRTIVSSIVGSMKSLCWTVVLLLLMMYIVGVYFTQNLTTYFVEKGGIVELSEEEENLRNHFSSLARTILSLFQAISGGVDWDSLASPLFMVNGVSGFLFALYIAFAVLALLNVVTGVFVQTALQSAKDEEDAFLTDQIVSLFSGGGRLIQLSEIEQALEDPEAAKEWKAIDIQSAEARQLFHLLDIEQDGSVDFEEFLSGCLRLRGLAKAMDVLIVMQEFRAFARKMTVAMMKVQSGVDKLKTLRLSQETQSRQDGVTHAHLQLLHKVQVDVNYLMQTRREDHQAIRDVRSMLKEAGLSSLQVLASILSNDSGGPPPDSETELDRINDELQRRTGGLRSELA